MQWYNFDSCLKKELKILTFVETSQFGPEFSLQLLWNFRSQNHLYYDKFKHIACVCGTETMHCRTLPSLSPVPPLLSHPSRAELSSPSNRPTPVIPQLSQPPLVIIELELREAVRGAIRLQKMPSYQGSVWFSCGGRNWDWRRITC